jgi:hypothetical protein
MRNTFPTLLALFTLAGCGPAKPPADQTETKPPVTTAPRARTSAMKHRAPTVQHKPSVSAHKAPVASTKRRTQTKRKPTAADTTPAQPSPLMHGNP